MRKRSTAYALLLALAVCLITTPIAAAAQVRPALGTPVYVLRGALGIFSNGMDGLADEMNANGVPAVSMGFENWRDYTAAIVRAYAAHRYPVVLVGHSWGANTILLMAHELGKHDIPVALLVFYDATASARISFPKRTITSQPLAGTTIDVDTPTHVAAPPTTTDPEAYPRLRPWHRTVATPRRN